jgi:hypothetical protein
MMKTLSPVLAFSLAVLAAHPAAWGEAATDKARAELAKALSGAKVSLGAGLTASSWAGKPISAKFEVEDGTLQISVYTEEKGTFSEVTVNSQTGKVVRRWPITEGEAFATAKRQSAALAKAKVPLSTAIAKAVANPGYDVVSVVPMLKNRHPVAQMTLVKGEKWKTLTEKLE